MEFTTQQMEQIDENINAINAFIYDTIVPQIHKPIRLDFGESRTLGRSTTTEWHLKVTHKEDLFTNGWGGDAHKGYVGIAECCGAPQEIHYVRYSAKYALISNWKQIKAKLIAEASEQRQEIDTRDQIINNFQI